MSEIVVFNELILNEFYYCLMSSQRNKDDPFIIDQRQSNQKRIKEDVSCKCQQGPVVQVKIQSKWCKKAVV